RSVNILKISQHSVADENVFESVQIDIEENRAPGPVRCLDATEPGGFGEGSVAAIHLECVPVDLGAIIPYPGRPAEGSSFAQLDVPLPVVGAEHIGDKKIN